MARRPKNTTRTTSSTALAPLERVVLTEGVTRSLFGQFADHRLSLRGDEEHGWALLGLRSGNSAVAMATLPAGGMRDASMAHVDFHHAAQVVASRVVRQRDKRLTLLGVVHTHPGSLRHPSDGDLRGDLPWVGRLRGGEGTFAIGTADVPVTLPDGQAYQPRPNVLCQGDLRFSWYALGQQQRTYRPLQVETTDGPDLARHLHLVWPTLEEHAERLERLARQQPSLTFDVLSACEGPCLLLTLPLDTRRSLRVLLAGSAPRYLLTTDDELEEVAAPDSQLDRAVSALLAELMT